MNAMVAGKMIVAVIVKMNVTAVGAAVCMIFCGGFFRGKEIDAAVTANVDVSNRDAAAVDNFKATSFLLIYGKLF